VKAEIVLPLVSLEGEVAALGARIEAAAADVAARRGRNVPVRVGAMIEVPRSALLAGRIAAHVEFLCFGSNDLTQTTFGVSREDAGAFLPAYVSRGLWRGDPFRTLDGSVVELLHIAATRARATRKGIHIGLCGEQAGDPESIHVLLAGAAAPLDYLSCSPFRLPIARLAAAQALLERKSSGGTGRGPFLDSSKRALLQSAGTRRRPRGGHGATAEERV
jgi:pyruvate,orthophosphate dikinase